MASWSDTLAQAKRDHADAQRVREHEARKRPVLTAEQVLRQERAATARIQFRLVESDEMRLTLLQCISDIDALEALVFDGQRWSSDEAPWRGEQVIVAEMADDIMECLISTRDRLQAVYAGPADRSQPISMANEDGTLFGEEPGDVKDSPPPEEDDPFVSAADCEGAEAAGQDFPTYFAEKNAVAVADAEEDAYHQQLVDEALGQGDGVTGDQLAQLAKKWNARRR